MQIVAAAEQRRALTAVLATLKPDMLALPEALLKIIPPRVPDYDRGREHFKIRTSPAFDALAPAEAAAENALQFLFNPERASRLVEFHARDAKNPALEEVLDAILTATWKSPRQIGYAGEISRVVDSIVLYNLMALSANDKASPQARAIASLKLDELKNLGHSRANRRERSRRARPPVFRCHANHAIPERPQAHPGSSPSPTARRPTHRR